MLPDDERHGTDAGCREHYRHGEKPCEPCQRAHMRAQKARRLRRSKTSALGSQRRIQALQAIGYGRDRIARELGYTDGGALTYLMQSDTVLVGTAQRIADVYERLCMTVPVGVGPTRARTWARRHGYAPPLLWDDIDNDDSANVTVMAIRPQQDIDHAVVWRVLSGEVLPTNTAERREIMRRWLASGQSEKSLCVRMSWREGRYRPNGVGAATDYVALEERAS